MTLEASLGLLDENQLSEDGPSTSTIFWKCVVGCFEGGEMENLNAAYSVPFHPPCNNQHR